MTKAFIHASSPVYGIWMCMSGKKEIDHKKHRERWEIEKVLTSIANPCQNPFCECLWKIFIAGDEICCWDKKEF